MRESANALYQTIKCLFHTHSYQRTERQSVIQLDLKVHN